MILLTGASGFVGSHMLKSSKLPITALFREEDKKNDAINYHPSTFVPSLDERTDFSLALKGINAVVHLAGIAHSKAKCDNDYFKINVDGTLNLAKQAANSGVSRFVFISSVGVNGSKTERTPFLTNDQPHPHNAYARSKYEAELGLRAISKETGMELVIIRPTLVYGIDAPGNFGQLLRFVSRFNILPFGLVKNRRNFVSIQNLVDLIDTCIIHNAAPGHIFFASDGDSISIKDFTNAIGKGIGRKVYQLPIPVGLIKLLGTISGKSQVIEQVCGNLEVDSSDLNKILDWVPPLSLEQSMALLSDNKND